jgi:hypothetical protein
MKIFRFKCETCGEEHDGLPDVGFDSPAYVQQVPEAERASRVLLTKDMCTIDSTDRFIRTCLEIPIRGTDATFVWGVWVSLSERNFQWYADHFKQDPPANEGPYFGWFSNRLPGYPNTLNLKTRVHLQPGGMRPMIELEASDHPLSKHQQEGIPLRDLLAIIGDKLHESISCRGDDAG